MRAVCVLFICAASMAAPIAAQQQDTVRPTVRGGIYDKPYLTTMLGRTAIGGYAEAHARWHQVDGVTEELGFVARRFNLFASTRISDFVRMAAELEVEEGGEELKLEFAAVDVIVHTAFALRAGMILSPIGRFNLSHDSPLNEFTDRPLPSTEIIGVAVSEPGLGALGTLPLGRGRLTYEMYAVNGYHAGLLDASEDGTRIPLGTGNVEDANRSPAFVGRVAWSPGLFLELGASAHHGAWNEWTIDGLEIDRRRDLTIFVADAELSIASTRLNGELVHARVELPPALDGLFAQRQRGLWVELLRDFGRGLVPTMPTSHFTAGIRFETVDFDTDLRGDMIRQWQAGVNFRPTAETVLKFSWLRGTSRDRFNNATEHAGARFSVATYF